MSLKKKAFSRFVIPVWLRIALGVALLLPAAMSAECDDADNPGVDTQLVQARKDLHQYSEISVARSRGFVPLKLFGIQELGYSGLILDRGPVMQVASDAPSRLIYNVQQDGRYQLWGAAWVLHPDLWDDPPELFGRPFTVRDVDPIRYASAEASLTVWLFVDNPSGMFAPTHPNLKAPTWWVDLIAARAWAEEMNGLDRVADAGYVNEGNCLVDPRLPRFGVFYVSSDEDYLDPNHPNALIFVLDVKGPRLAGLQWRMPIRKGNTRPCNPGMFGQPFGGPHTSADRYGKLRSYYSLTVWPFHDHPRGVFTHPGSRRCVFDAP